NVRVVEHRHLARAQLEVDGRRLVERLGNVLTARQDAARVVGLLMGQDAPLVRARDAAQTALPAPAPGGPRGPGAPGDGRAVVRVLVPAREGLAVGPLHPPGHAPAAEVR